MTVNPRDDALIKKLSGDFQLRNEPNFACGQALSTLLALPGLRGLWPMSVVSSTPTAIDVSGLGKALAYNGNPTFGYSGLAPCINLDGTGDFLSRADEADLDIIGNEAYIASKGLTVGGWFSATALAAVSMLISKNTDAGNQRSWYIFVNTPSNLPTWRISTTGAAVVTLAHTTAMSLATWYFIAARFTPSTEMAIWVNGTKVTGVAGIPATLFNSSADLQIGANNAGINLLNGRASNVFLCASAVPDVQIFNVYQQTRAMYGV